MLCVQEPPPLLPPLRVADLVREIEENDKKTALMVKRQYDLMRVHKKLGGHMTLSRRVGGSESPRALRAKERAERKGTHDIV